MDGHDAFGICKALKPRHIEALEATRGQAGLAGGYADARLRAYEGEGRHWKVIARNVAGAPRSPGRKARGKKAMREINQPYRQLRLF